MTKIPINKYLKVFADCIPVKGTLRSIIYDLTRLDYEFIPNEVFYFLDTFQGKRMNIVKKAIDDDRSGLLNEYFEHLIQKDYIFFCSEEEILRFPKHDFSWDYPSIISTAIIEVESTNITHSENIIRVLQQIGCSQFQILCKEQLSIKEIENIASFFDSSGTEAIELVLKYNTNIQTKELVRLFKQYRRIRLLNFHTAPKDEILEIGKEEDKKEKCFLLKQELKYDEFVDFDYFTIRIAFFSEAQHFSTYFNRKIFIDTAGDMKNHPLQNDSFGNVYNDNIRETVKTKAFQHLWTASKDQTYICQDCEFRYMCFDNRIPEKDKEGVWFHNKSCNYNPYIAKWKGEDGYLDTNSYWLENKSIKN